LVQIPFSSAANNISHRRSAEAATLGGSSIGFGRVDRKFGAIGAAGDLPRDFQHGALPEEKYIER